MNNKNLFIKQSAAALLLFTAAVSAHSAAAQYQFTVSHYREIDANYDPVDPGDYLFADGSAVFGSFFYDNSVTASGSNIHDSGDLAPFGLLSIYDGAVTGIAASVNGHGFSALSSMTMVGNSDPGDTTFLDGVFHMAGELDAEGYYAGSGFQGFTIGDFTLVGMNLYSIGSPYYLSGQALPNTLTDPAVLGSGLNLIFFDSQHNMRIAQFEGSIAPVPLPATELLFGSGLGMLWLRSRRRACAPA